MIPRRPVVVPPAEIEAPKHYRREPIINIDACFPGAEWRDLLCPENGDTLDRSTDRWVLTRNGKTVTIDISKAYWWSVEETTRAVEVPFVLSEGAHSE